MDSANRPGIKAATLIFGDDENSFRLPNKGKHGVSLGPRGRPKGSHVLNSPILGTGVGGGLGVFSPGNINNIPRTLPIWGMLKSGPNFHGIRSLT